MALLPEAYEKAWKNDPAIRAMAEGCLREWRGKIKQAETAWELTRLIESKQDPDKVLSVILGIMMLDEKDEETDMLAAGPLEDFLVHSGPEYIDAVEKLAAKIPRFRSLLSGVWQSTIDLNVWKRIEKVRGQVR